MTSIETRQAQWGHWGITFFEKEPHAYAPSKIHGTVSFPVGNCGPCDLPRRDAYNEMIRAWRQDGVLPAELRS